MARSESPLTPKAATHLRSSAEIAMDKTGGPEKKAPTKDTVAHKKGELRHMSGVIEDPHAVGEAGATADQKGETQINATTRRTYETVVFREYNALSTIISADVALQKAVTDFRRGGDVAKLTSIATAKGLTVDQLMFYADFTSSAHLASNKLETPDAVLSQCSLYMQRTDHLLTASQIATRQLSVLQSAASADVVDFQISAEKREYEGDVFIYDENSQPATKADMYRKNRSFFRKVFPTSEEKKGASRATDIDKRKKGNEKKDEDLRYGGVRFLRNNGGKIETITSGDIPLTTTSAYESAIVGGAPGESLHGADDMRRYGQRVHGIIEARVDLYRSFGMELGDINARVFDMQPTPGGGIGLTENHNAYAFFDIERSHTGTPEQRIEAQRQSVEKTKKAIDKARTEQKKEDKAKTLEAERKKWRIELGEPSEDETKNNEAETKKLTEDQKKVTEKKTKTDALIQEDKDRLDNEKRKKEIMDETGALQTEVDTYRTTVDEIASAQATIDLEEAQIAILEKRYDKLAKRADQLGVEVTAVGGEKTRTPDAALSAKARDLQIEIDAAQVKADAARTTKAAKEKARDDIVALHKDRGLTRTLMDEIITVEDTITTKVAQIAAARADLGMAAADPIPTSTEDMQKEIDKFTKLIAEVGQDRLQDRQKEILTTYEEMIATVDSQNERLQQHMIGELIDIPDVPHLVGYPRMYLRTLQILFGGDIVLPGNEAQLNKCMSLMTPDDFVQLANARPIAGASVFDTRLQHPSEKLLQREYDAINDALLSSIRTELDSRVIHHTLGGTPEDIRRYEMAKTLQKVEPNAAAKAVIDPLLTGAPPTINLDERSRDAYYGDTPEELAYQLMRFDTATFPDMTNPDTQMQALYLAQRMIRSRKTNIQI